MNQYSPKNQAYLLAQLPTATDVRPFKAWKAAGRSVKKGEKALHVWIPKRGKAQPTEAAMATMSGEQIREYFVRGPVFDISQTKETPSSKREKSMNAERQTYELDQAYADFEAAVNAGDIPPDMDMGIWLELRDESRMAAIMADAGALGMDAILRIYDRGMITTAEAAEMLIETARHDAGTLAAIGHDGRPVIIAEYQHVNA